MVIVPTTIEPSFWLDAAVEEVADPVDVEDPLGDDGTAHQRADVDADVGDDRDQRVAEGVDADRPACASGPWPWPCARSRPAGSPPGWSASAGPRRPPRSTPARTPAGSAGRRCPGSTVTGNQPSFTPKISWARLPITKIGMEIRTSVLTVTRLSTNLPRRMPASTPAEMPITISMMIAIRASLIVVGQRMASSSATSLPEEVGAQVTLQQVAQVEQVLDDQRLVEVVLGPELGDVGRGQGRSPQRPTVGSPQREDHRRR